MDYAHVIRKSYSRPRNSRTTDQLVIEDTTQQFDFKNLKEQTPQGKSPLKIREK